MIGNIFKMGFALIGAALMFALYQIAHKVPALVEYVYSRGIYPFFTKTIGRVSAALPFSLAELLLYLLIAGIVFFIGYIIAALFKPRGEKLLHIGKRLLSFASLLCTLYSIFVLFWGLNYARLPLADSMGLDTSSGYTTAQLRELCTDLIDTCNTLRTQVDEDENGVYRLSCTRESVMEQMGDIYDAYAPDYMNKAAHCAVKPVKTPNALSRIETSGIFSPFTLEPNLNMQMPDLYFASTAAHEYAHLQGFAREDEANFIAWYVLSQSDRPDLAYSANVDALRSALNAYYRTGAEDYAEVYGLLCEGVRRDYSAQSAYWKPFRDTKIAEVSDKVYNSYLNSNGVAEGTRSYGRMVDLMLALRAETIP